MYTKAQLWLIALLLATFAAGFGRAGAASAAAMPVRWGYYVGYDQETSLPSLKARLRRGELTHVSPWYGFRVDANGALLGKDDPEVTALIRKGGAKVVPLIQNGARYDDFHKVISSAAKRARLVAAIAALVEAGGYHGVNIDFEGVNADDRPYLTAFMSELYPVLHDRSKLTTMAVPAKGRDATTGWAGAYDYAALAPYNDLVVIMAYDLHWPAGSPGPVSSLPWLRSVATYAKSQLGGQKLVVGMALYGYDWDVTSGSDAQSVKYPRIGELRRQYGAKLSYDVVQGAAKAEYTKDGHRHEVWYENARSVNAKLALARSIGARGVAYWRLGQEDVRAWNAVRGLAATASALTFSPDGDGQRERVRLVYALQESNKSLGIEVRDAVGRLVRTLRPAAAAPKGKGSVVWDGRDADGARVPEGWYDGLVHVRVSGAPVTDGARLVVDHTFGRFHAAPYRVSPPKERLKGGYTLTRRARVGTVVRDASGEVVRTIKYDGMRRKGRYTFGWNGRDDGGQLVPEGRYALVVRARSYLGTTVATKWVRVER